MSWSFGDAPPAISTGGGAQAGDDLEEWQSSELGFTPLQIDQKAKLKFFEPWPQDGPPSTTASLLSVASKNQLLAAAGPDSVILVNTEELRNQYIPARKKHGGLGNETQPDEPAVKAVQPKLRLPVSGVTHLAFISDETCLVLVAKDGLGVYATNDLLNGSTDPAFQVPTAGQAVRHILPNPNPESSHLLGLVLGNGQLILADLKERRLVTGKSGTAVFHEGVSGAAWSKLGKQIVVGLEDGSAAQVDPQGEVKDRIPVAPQLNDLAKELADVPPGLPITAISWLTTHEFLLVYTPVYRPDVTGPNDSIYLLAQRDGKGKPYKFRRAFPDPCPALGGRFPAHTSIQRLSDWSPHLKDALIVTSSASCDVGLFARLDGDFVMAYIEEDSRRAILPMSIKDGSSETSPVGTALDWSGDVLIARPVLGQEDLIDQSAVPLPIFCLMNTDGLLFMWWFIYADGVKNKAIYPGLTNTTGPYKTLDDFASKSGAPASQPKARDEETEDTMEMAETEHAPAGNQAPAPAQRASSVESPFAGKSGSQPSLGTPFSSFASPTTQQSAFGKPAFGAPSTPGFGGASTFGQKSPWGSSSPSAAQSSNTASAFGKPSAFGSTTPLGQGSGFGQVGGLGVNKGSLWGPSQKTDSQPPAASSPFGGGGGGAQSPFAKFGTQTSGFGAFANNNQSKASPFATAAKPTSGGSFGAPSQKPSFNQEQSMGSTATLGSTGSSFSFGQPSATPTASFGSKPALSKEATMDEDSFKQGQPKPNAGGTFGLPSGGFKLGSTFTGDGTAKDDLPKPKDSGAGFFGAGFGTALGGMETQKPKAHIKSEPGTEQPPSLQDIPEVKAPEEEIAIPEEAPLPPDPSTYKAPKMEDVDAIIALGSARKEVNSDAPLAGSPPVDLGSEHFSSVAGSEDAGPDEDEWDDEDDGEEDDGEEEDVEFEDEDDDEDPEEADESVQGRNEAKVSQLPTDFMKRVQPPSPNLATSPDEATTPASYAHSSYTPKTPHFPPPGPRVQGTPRSPSPQRAVTSPVRSRPPVASTTKLNLKPTTVAPLQPMAQSQPPVLQPPQPAPAELLEDEVNKRVQGVLNVPVSPDKAMPPFHVYHEYTGTSEKTGIAGQIDKVYRDINCMINTVGLNARSMRGFLDGHELPSGSDELSLDDPDAWAIGDIGALGDAVTDLGEQLHEGKVDNVRQKTMDLKDEQDQTLKVKAKTVELRRQITAHTDPERRAMQEAAPLSTDTATQQAELRHGIVKVQRLLSELEDKMSMLRADLASVVAQKQKSSMGPQAPTVEAVQNTILKMTAMVEQKSGDIDVLEAQIRRLPHGLAALSLDEGDDETDLVNGLRGNQLLAGSPASTPRRPRMAANGDALGMSGMFGPLKTPPARRGVFSPSASALVRSTGSLSGSARRLQQQKKMSDVTAEEVEAFHARRARRAAVLGALKGHVESRGARVVRVD